MNFLTRAEEADLIASWQSKRDERAVTRLTAAFEPLVRKTVKKFRKGKVPQEDLMQEGMCGLLSALERYDPSTGNRLGTYAQWWILAAVSDAVLAQGGPVRTGRGKKIKQQFYCGELNIAALSLDALVQGSDRLTLADTLQSEDPGPDQIVEEDQEATYWGQQIAAAMDRLSPRERRIIERRWLGEEKETLDVIGADLGVSKERVRQIEQVALGDLRKTLARAM